MGYVQAVMLQQHMGQHAGLHTEARARTFSPRFKFMVFKMF